MTAIAPTNPHLAPGRSPTPIAPALTACAALLLLTATAGAASDAPAAPETRALLIDDQLSTRPVSVLSLDDQLLTFLDEQQRRRTLARPAFLALIVEKAPDPTPLRRRPPIRTVPGMIELIDTQRFPGDLLPAAAGNETIAWSQPLLGQLIFPLDRVWSFSRPTTPAARKNLNLIGTAASDTIYLVNGDQLNGFLASAGDPIRIESDGAAIELPPDRIAAARLSNSRQQPAGAWLWLADGTVARASRLSIEHPGRLSIALDAGPATSLRWDQTRAILLDAARLRPLARLEPDSWSPAEGRRYAPPIQTIRLPESEDPAGILSAPLDADDILLPGPMRITWTLPPNARRIAFTASLAESTAPWGDCELIARIDHNELARRRLHTDAPAAAISIPAEGRTLTISIEPGRFGPIRDWIILTRPMILIAPPNQP